MRHALKIMLTVMALLTAFHGFRAFLGPQAYATFHEFMFADYVALYDRHGGSLWGLLSAQASREEFRPFLVAGAVIAALAVLLRFLTISRNICAIIGGVFLFDLGLWYFADGEPLSTRFALIGTGALLWVVLSGFVTVEDGGTGRFLRRLWRRIKS